MTLHSRFLPTPDTSTAEHVAAVLDVVTELYKLLDARLPAPASADGGGPGDPVPVSEPDRQARPAEVVPVSEPAPDVPPDSDDDEPVKAAEPEPAEKPSLPPPPPHRGRGSGLDAWQAYANLAGVTYPDDAGRDDIIAACQRAGVIDTE
ncbi:hypothetical protein ACFYUR_18720 [Micromonospora haikouensis]|uniref:hypothetical protein n=1 Tax=Micromonospora haikouensis TaxID=686309 RepID=UPI0036B7E3F2